MQDISDKVGVSKCTVSLVLNGKAKEKRISDSVCERVFAAAKELNYQPNELARGLRTGQTKTIGVIVADISNEFFGSLVYHIQQHATSLGYSLIITNSDEGPMRMFEQVQLLINRQVDGIIMVPTFGSMRYAELFVNIGIPFVQIDRFIPELNSSYVILDNFKSSKEVTGRLISKGCKRISIFKHKNSTINGRFEGYVAALQECGLFDENLVVDIDYTCEDSDTERAIDALLGSEKKVDGIFFHSHELFLCGVRYLNRKGIRIPEDVQIASFDKIDAYSLVNFPMVYAVQPIAQLGHSAVDILVGHINGSRTPVQRIIEGTVEEL